MILEHLRPYNDAFNDSDFWYQLEGDLVRLGELNENEFLEKGEVRFLYKKVAAVRVKGIPEDYKVFIGNKLLCEVIYGNVHDLNKKLAHQYFYVG